MRGLQEQIEQFVRLNFPVSNNEAEYEAMIVVLELTSILATLKVEIRSGFQLVVRQIQCEYEARVERMTRNLNNVESYLAKLVN
ncbi:hypothetical protein CK203_100704 [Vitis vinifera]|uniref:RNase H type-1 domain-containing protein n=1 Tax=Vitis vinifera TaxID=29760 RepID=A0A438FJD7_VITVI|nr:hypothetical protein CK203_100704 [Vitis vinifera]